VLKYLVVLLALLSLVCCGNEALSPEISALTAQPKKGTAPSADGVKISFTRRGEGETALVFIHGWMCDSTFWQAQVDVFANEFTVVAVDLAGHGESGLDRNDWTISSLGFDVQAVVEAADLERVILIGHSMGGPVALCAAQSMPQKVIGVVGIDTLADAEFNWDPDRFKQILERDRQDFVGTCGVFVKMMFTDQSELSLVESVTAKMCDAPPEVAIALLEDTSTYNMKAAFEAVQVPVRCINADRFPTRVEINRKYSDDYDAIVMKEVGHFPMMETPAEFNRQLQTVLDELKSR
jgi:pimeloyl-ACP methyl ester carboxylesterase